MFNLLFIVGTTMTRTAANPHHFAGLGHFEDAVRTAEQSLPVSPYVASPLDLRVSKGVGRRGYESVRISVISRGAAEASRVDLRALDPLAYNNTFRYRWESSFDLGVAKTVRCTHAALHSGNQRGYLPCP